MVYRKKVKIKGQEYWYLFHTVREGNKYLKKSKYLGKELPKNIKEIEREFLEEIKQSSEAPEDKVLESLHPLERKVLPHAQGSVTDIAKKTNLSETEVVRALQWLENKDLVKRTHTEQEIINVGKNGQQYQKESLPEQRFLKTLNKPKTMQQIQEQAHLDKDELYFCLGYLKKNNFIQIGKEITRTKEPARKIESTQKFLQSLPRSLQHLTKEEQTIMQELRQRKELIEVEVKKETQAVLTDQGKILSKKNLNISLIESLTPELLAKKAWQGKKFRRYDVSLSVPKIYPGKKHFVKQAISYAKRVWTDMGFQEMEGPMINTSFWNFDALFTPQDHPAREMQDSIFLARKQDIKEKELMKKIKAMHETGSGISKGWQYTWDEEVAKKLVMRTHTTVLSAKTLAKLKETDLPAKFFAIGRNFRNESVDWSHGFEFNQTEGIVIDPNANFRDLLGYLKEFFKKMGFKNARFRPAYFPYTEPSVEIDVYHPIHKKWIELGGAGMFRPEVVIPLLGKETPVLAWGPGFDRLILDYYNIHDIRELYKNDIKQLRETKVWLK